MAPSPSFSLRRSSPEEPVPNRAVGSRDANVTMSMTAFDTRLGGYVPPIQRAALILSGVAAHADLGLPYRRGGV